MPSLNACWKLCSCQASTSRTPPSRYRGTSERIWASSLWCFDPRSTAGGGAVGRLGGMMASSALRYSQVITNYVIPCLGTTPLVDVGP